MLVVGLLASEEQGLQRKAQAGLPLHPFFYFLLYALVQEVKYAGMVGGVAVLSQSDLAFSLYLSRWLENSWRAKQYFL